MQWVKIGKHNPERIYANARDIHVSRYVVYPNEDGIACLDPEGLDPIGSVVLEDLYVKGCIIIDGGVFCTPVSMRFGEQVELTYLKMDPETEEPVFLTITGTAAEVTDPPSLLSLNVGSNELLPAFSPEVLSYAVETEETSDLIAFVTSPENVEFTVSHNGVEIADPEDLTIVWAQGENVILITLIDGEVEVTYTVTVTASVPAPTLSALTIGSLTLSPSFDSGVVAYTAATTDTSNILTFTTVPNDAPVVVKLGDEPITTYSEGIVWTGGENILTITVGEAPAAVTYTVTVTAS